MSNPYPKTTSTPGEDQAGNLDLRLQALSMASHWEQMRTEATEDAQADAGETPAVTERPMAADSTVPVAFQLPSVPAAELTTEMQKSRLEKAEAVYGAITELNDEASDDDNRTSLNTKA